MGTPAGPRAERRISRWLIPAIGFAISLVSLVWVFAHFPIAQMGDHLRTMDWSWLILAIAIESASFFLDGWRWRELLRPAGLPPYGVAVQSVFAGVFVNDVLPARAGEVVRCFLLWYETDIHLPLVITSWAVLRVIDGAWIVIFYFATSHAVETTRLATFVMAAYAAVVGLLLFVLFHHHHARHFANKSGWGARFTHFLDEIHKLADWRQLCIVTLSSGFYWTLQICSVWAIARADHFYFSFDQMTFLLIAKSVSTLLPAAPAGIGTFQASALYALRLFLTEAPDAKILAELLFGFLTLPGLIGGGIAVALAGYNLKDLVRHAQESHRKHKAPKQ